MKIHPKIFIPDIKETDFLRKEQLSDGDLSQYKSVFSEAAPDASAGEISTLYISDPNVPFHLRRYVPEIRIFTVLRNPIDQIQSHYWHLQRQQFHMWTRSQAPKHSRKQSISSGMN